MWHTSVQAKVFRTHFITLAIQHISTRTFIQKRQRKRENEKKCRNNKNKYISKHKKLFSKNISRFENEKKEKEKN